MTAHGLGSAHHLLLFRKISYMKTEPVFVLNYFGATHA